MQREDTKSQTHGITRAEKLFPCRLSHPRNIWDSQEEMMKEGGVGGADFREFVDVGKQV